jgi:hypothetical protein
MTSNRVAVIVRVVNEQTKAAYRHLLYVAMLAIRIDCQSRARECRNPFEWRRQYRRSRVAGATADWLHNLAQFSSLDFARFNEQQFWTEHSHLCRRFSGERLERYHEIFDEYLAGRVSVCL